MSEPAKMRPPLVTLPESRLRSMIAGAFRHGADIERMGEIKSTEDAYSWSEHHANGIVEEFMDAGFIARTDHPIEEQS